MKYAISSLAVLWVLAAGADAGESWTGRCDVVFHVKATMHQFDGTAQSDPVGVNFNGGKASWTVAVPVSGMSTRNVKRDREMREMLHAHDHAQIVGQAAAVNWKALAGGGAAPADLPFDLTIAGTTRSLKAAVSDWKEDGDQVSFRARFTVSLKEFKLKPPSVIGMIRVADAVTVNAHFVFTRP
jgi:polyisoprenoid-binding protein YceI